MTIKHYLKWENFIQTLNERNIKKGWFSKIAWIAKQIIYDQEERYNEWKKIWIPERTYNRYFEWLKKILWDDFDQSLYFETFSVEYKKILTII